MADLDRVLRPSSVALVGVTDHAVMAQTVRSVLDTDVRVHLVNPKHPEVFGRPTVPSLSAVGEPVDAVVSFLAAARTVELAEEAAGLDVGGLIVVAGGFSELGDQGGDLQRRLAAAAAEGGMAVVGPNGVGYIDVHRNLELTFLPRFGRRPGGVSVVAHSGALLEAFAAAAHRPGGAGLAKLVSAGNEAVTDVADYVAFLADDADTRVIVLGIEKVRRPKAFVAAVLRAHANGKPVVAMKLGRSERSRELARSHTGTVTQDSWIYDVAFRQLGIATAADVDELVDRVQILEQLPSERWSAVRGLAVLTGTGGFASLSADLAIEESVSVPEVPSLSEWVGTVVPGARVANPLDATGFILGDDSIWDAVVERYLATPELDSWVFLSQFAAWDTRSRRFSDRFAAMAKATEGPVLVSPLAGLAADWVDEYRTDHGVAVGNGLRGTLRGLHAMGAFVRRGDDWGARIAEPVPPRPEPADWVTADGAEILRFDTAMGLLVDAGLTVAPFTVVEDGDPVVWPDGPGPFVVKLADLPHRTEHGAVRLGVAAADLGAAVDDLRTLAHQHGFPARVAIQEQVAGHGEAFLGLQARSELGPAVAFGLGGVFVEVLQRVSGCLAPATTADARRVVEEFADLGVLDGVRGRPPWDRDAVAALIVAAGDLVAAVAGWSGSIDLNPIIVSERGLTVVDVAWFRA